MSIVWTQMDGEKQDNSALLHLRDHVDYTDPSLVVAMCGAVAHVNENVMAPTRDRFILSDDPKCPACKNLAEYDKEDLESSNPWLQNSY